MKLSPGSFIILFQKSPMSSILAPIGYYSNYCFPTSLSNRSNAMAGSIHRRLSPNRRRRKQPTQFSNRSQTQHTDNDEEDRAGRGVRDDLTEFTETLTRRLWGRRVFSRFSSTAISLIHQSPITQIRRFGRWIRISGRLKRRIELGTPLV